MQDAVISDSGTAEVPPGEAFRRGYSNLAHLRADIAAAHATSLRRSVLTAAADHMSIPSLALAVPLFIAQVMPTWVALLSGITVVVLMGRQLRALECLVHEASHFNWSRRHRCLNDLLAVLLAVIPTGALLPEYRRSHLLHHGQFGTAADPDRQRYEELGIEDIDRTRLIRFTAGIIRRYGKYQRGWLGSLGEKPLIVMLPPAWATTTCAFPAWLVGGTASAAIAVGLWLAAYVVVLPVVRFVGESDEHLYRDGETVFDATVSNLGIVQRLLFHPHGDGYHTVHHLWPGVPHHRLARLHQTLLSRDPAYAGRLRYRKRTLSAPGSREKLFPLASRVGETSRR